MKSKLCLIMALIMILGVFAGCSDTPAATNENGTTASGDSNASPDNTGGETQKILPDLPTDKTYDNYEFVILISGNSELNTLKNDIQADEITGEAINDAKYNRNLAIEDRYKVKLVSHELAAGTDNGTTEIRKSVLAQDYAYDAAIVGGYSACNLAQQGNLLDLNASVPYIDLSKPWWDQKANEDLTVMNKMYYTTGDLCLSTNDATYAILFNKNLITDYKLDDPYELVRSGKWTVDKFGEMANIVHDDLNGDGAYDTNDLYGALIWDDSMMGIINASGDKCCTVNKSTGEIELTLYNEKTLSMFEKYTNIVFNQEVCHAYQRKNWDGVASNKMFAGNQSLFYLQLLQLVTSLREMDADFGILPYFKYDEAQTEYFNTVGSWHSMFLCVPVGQENVERTGIIIEALAAESRYTVRPAYYEITLKGKSIRDEESSEMLDIILSTRTFDLGWYYAIGAYNEGIMNQFRNYKADFTSLYTKSEKMANKSISKINEAFANAEN